jgi:ribonuclease D
MTIELYKNDIPNSLDLGSKIAVDTEAMGLNNHRDRLCLVQLSSGDGTAHLVQFEDKNYNAPNLKKVLSDTKKLKLFHFARFDVAIIKKYLEISCTPLYCTRTASYLARTYTDRHGLRDVCKELIGVDLSKQQQSSDWGSDSLTEEQMKYAANDVLHLHALQEKLDEMLEREGRYELAYNVFNCIQTRSELDLAGWENVDIFAH